MKGMLAVVIPAYNEEESLDNLMMALEQTREELDFKVIFVDDGSTDGTREKIEGYMKARPWIDVVHHETNMGLARSLKDGFSHAAAQGYELIGQMDADLTHPPALLKDMVKALEEADAAVASRYVAGGGMRDVPGWRVLLSRAGNLGFRLILGIRTRDATSGYRIYRRRVLESIDLASDSFGIQLEATVKAERKGFTIAEVPFVLANRKAGRSKFRLSYLLGYVPLALRLAVRRR